jgi:hypothetical protein
MSLAFGGADDMALILGGNTLAGCTGLGAAAGVGRMESDIGYTTLEKRF